jgi:hypothetical protein
MFNWFKNEDENQTRIITYELYRISHCLGRKRYGLFKYKNFEFTDYGIYLESDNHRLCVNYFGKWEVVGLLLEKSKEAYNEVLFILDRYDKYMKKKEQELKIINEQKHKETIDYFTRLFL